MLTTLYSRYSRCWYLEYTYFLLLLLLPPCSKPLSFWTWFCFIVQSISPKVVKRIILIHKTNHVTSSVQHVPEVSCLTQETFTVIKIPCTKIYVLWLIFIAQLHLLLLLLTYSTTPTLTSKHSLKHTEHASSSDFALADLLTWDVLPPDAWFAPCHHAVSAHVPPYYRALYTTKNNNDNTTSSSIPAYIHSLPYLPCFNF